MDALLLVAFFVGVAVASQRWGYDSRDGFASQEYARRQAWLAGPSGPSCRDTSAPAPLAARTTPPLGVVGTTTDLDGRGLAAAYVVGWLAVAAE